MVCNNRDREDVFRKTYRDKIKQNMKNFSLSREDAQILVTEKETEEANG